jgi:hypothetical protein
LLASANDFWSIAENRYRDDMYHFDQLQHATVVQNGSCSCGWKHTCSPRPGTADR